MNTPTPINADTHAEFKVSPLFSLLQISDPLFPIGGYTQSFGLETYVQKGIVHDADTSQKYLKSYLLNQFLYNDLLAVRLAWEYADREDLEAIGGLDRLLSAAKASREPRMGSIKLGVRFSRIVDTVLKGRRLFDSYVQAIESGNCAGHYSVMYGVAAKLLGIGKTEALSAFSYGAASAIVTNCAKLVPISQKDGQDILFGAHGALQQLIDEVEALNEDSLGTCCPGFDLRAMQHERLYSRLYIS